MDLYEIFTLVSCLQFIYLIKHLQHSQIMKHVLIITSLALFAQLSQAQTTPSDTLRPKAKEKQITIALNNNNSGSLLFKKYTSATFAYRIGLGGGYGSSSTENTTNNSSYINTNYKYKSSNFDIYLNLGIQKSFGSYKNFEPYAGVDLGIGNRILSQKEENINTLNPFTSFAPNSIVKTTRETKSNFTPSVSLLPFIGFNYYIAERFALGVEYKLRIVSFSTYDNSKSTFTTEYGDGTSQVTDDSKYKSTNFNGSFTGTTNITATFFIGK
jgi:hypothetical protein